MKTRRGGRDASRTLSSDPMVHESIAVSLPEITLPGSRKDTSPHQPTQFLPSPPLPSVPSVPSPRCVDIVHSVLAHPPPPADGDPSSPIIFTPVLAHGVHACLLADGRDLSGADLRTQAEVGARGERQRLRHRKGEQ